MRFYSFWFTTSILVSSFLVQGQRSEEDILKQLKRVISETINLPPDYNVLDGEEFEYVVVGAGAAGSAVAARLALAGYNVLLIEAGGDPPPLTRVPNAAMTLLGSEVDWQYRTLPNGRSCLGSDGTQCRFSRGKTLGGSTSINYMMYVRGNPQDYELGIPGWTWKELEPYFLRYEGLRDLMRLPPTSIPYHNTTGTMRIGFSADPENEWHEKLVEGFQQRGFPFNPDVNAESQIGVTRVITYTSDGERESTARGYLAREDVRRLLRVARNTRCTSVLFDEDNNAVGVSVVRGSSVAKVQVRASRGVILSAGAIGTPQLLQLSGIGPQDHLTDLGIPVRANLPVGDNMSDHVLPLVFISSDRPPLETLGAAALAGADTAQYARNRTGPMASIGLTDITALLSTSCYDFKSKRLLDLGSECQRPTLQLIHAYIERGAASLGSAFVKTGTGLNDNIIAQLSEINTRRALVVASPVLLAPYSRGTVRLASSDPLAPPEIFPNYFGDDRDIDEAVRAITLIEQLVETPAYRSMGARVERLVLPSCPRYEIDRVGYWRCYSRHLTFSVFHAAGTVALGTVLDERLAVRGTNRLHVADLSALPVVPRGNTAAVSIALGECLSDFLLEDLTNEEYFKDWWIKPSYHLKHKAGQLHRRNKTRE